MKRMTISSSSVVDLVASGSSGSLILFETSGASCSAIFGLSFVETIEGYVIFGNLCCFNFYSMFPFLVSLFARANELHSGGGGGALFALL